MKGEKPLDQRAAGQSRGKEWLDSWKKNQMKKRVGKKQELRSWLWKGIRLLFFAFLFHPMIFVPWYDRPGNSQVLHLRQAEREREREIFCWKTLLAYIEPTKWWWTKWWWWCDYAAPATTTATTNRILKAHSGPGYRVLRGNELFSFRTYS